GVRNQMIDGPDPTITTVPPAAAVPAMVAVGHEGGLPTVPSTTAPETVADGATKPFGTALGGAGATLARPDGVRPQGQRSRRRRRWGAIGVLAGIAVLAAAIGLWASSGPSVVTVPAVQHMTVSDAASVITKAGLRVSTHPVDGGTAPDRIVAQSPPARARVKTGSTVSLGVSSGYVDLPSSQLIGKQYAQAAASLVGLGLRPSRQETASSSPTGTVLAVNPSGRVKVGTTIDLSVAVAPVTTTVPVTEPTVPATKPTVPVTEPTVPATKPTVPATAPTNPGHGQGGGQGDSQSKHGKT
ncbi:MAG TPA: PASTA domain-containing protein, partial [Acidimicrobiales bacterium]|nr:PASTA domain-containing protein [Acidimicrobiales bacterium]